MRARAEIERDLQDAKASEDQYMKLSREASSENYSVHYEGMAEGASQRVSLLEAELREHDAASEDPMPWTPARRDELRARFPRVKRKVPRTVTRAEWNMVSSALDVRNHRTLLDAIEMCMIEHDAERAAHDAMESALSALMTEVATVLTTLRTAGAGEDDAVVRKLSLALSAAEQAK